jgi:hypothetical protein
MKFWGCMVVGLVLALMLRDGLDPPRIAEASMPAAAIVQVADPFETTAPVREGCREPDLAGRYLIKEHQIFICTAVIEQKAIALGVPADDLKRYILAHEAAHSRGELDEQKTDKIAADRLFAAGDYAALKAYGAIPSNGTVYDFGRRYAQTKVQSIK